MARRGKARAFVVAAASVSTLLGACGESRLSNGEACLRNDDCLSNVCSDRVCVPSPTLSTGGPSTSPSDEPDLPDEAGVIARDGGNENG